MANGKAKRGTKTPLFLDANARVILGVPVSFQGTPETAAKRCVAFFDCLADGIDDRQQIEGEEDGQATG